jgi:uroporphyrin-III C-methyltransferase
MTTKLQTTPHSRGSVFLVGAGPGDPELLTLKAARLLAQADVVLIDDLANDEILSLCPQARVVHVGKRGGCKSTPQAFIEKLLVREALAGHKVVRLKGGDPSVFGRAGEELSALAAHGIECEIVPGISAGLAAAATIGASLTHRDAAHGVAFLTAHGAEGAAIDWRALANANITLVIYMGVSRAQQLQADLLEGGMPSTTPLIAVENASRANSRSIATTLGCMTRDFTDANLQSPSVIVIGEAMRERALALLREGAPVHSHGASPTAASNSSTRVA